MGRSSPLLRIFAASSGGFAGFYVLISAVPVLGLRIGGSFAAGLLTFLFMGGTVAAQLAASRLLSRWSYGVLLAAALVLLGAPAVAYSAVGGRLWVAAVVTVVRGAGFGIMTVVGSILVAAYAPVERRGAAFGAYGLISGASGIVGPALGLLLYRDVAPAAAFAIAAALPCASALFLLRPLPEVELAEQEPLARLVGGRRRLLYPTIVFLPATLALGGVYTFLPARAAGRATVALLVFGLAFALTRQACGRLVDRGVRAEIIAAVLAGLGAAGMLAVALSTRPLLLMAGAVLAGAGTGGLCTVTLITLLGRSGPSLYSAVSTLWNVAYDAGVAVGGLALGAIARGAGVAAAFAVAGVVLAAVAVPAALRDLRDGSVDALGRP